jgi:hypothetical protein
VVVVVMMMMMMMMMIIITTTIIIIKESSVSRFYSSGMYLPVFGSQKTKTVMVILFTVRTFKSHAQVFLHHKDICTCNGKQ